MRKKKSHCVYGHIRTPENVSVNNHCRACARRDAKKYSDRRWARQIRDLYGITPVQYDFLLARQDFCCAICKRPAGTIKKRLDIDHNHENGEIRGLLCTRCNGKVLIVLENWRHLVPIAQAYLKGDLYAPISAVPNCREHTQSEAA